MASVPVVVPGWGRSVVENPAVLLRCAGGPASIRNGFGLDRAILVELVEVQPEGKPRISAQDWKKGARLDAQSRLGS